MDDLEICIDKLINIDHETEYPSNSNNLYNLLAKITFPDHDNYFMEIIMPKLIVLLDDKKVEKNFLVLSLICNEDKKVLESFVNFEKSAISLNIFDPGLLFDYCFFMKRNWFLKVIEDEIAIEENQFSKNIVSTIKILKLIKQSNESQVNINELAENLPQLDLNINRFNEFYLKSLTIEIDIVNLCLKYLKPNINMSESEIYYFSCMNSPLTTISKFLNLQSSHDIRNIVLLKLNNYNNESQVETFTAYIILFNILHCLHSCKSIKQSNITKKDEISEVIQETEDKLLNLTNFKLQMELLENIFSFLFLQENHFIVKKICDTNILTFYCSENEVRLILMFLKSVCDKIKMRNLYDKESEEFKKFTQLNKYLADGLWRLELIATNAKHEKHTKNKIKKDIISFMLAPPESLIHLCLKENDFERAHQVVQIFNLHTLNIASNIRYNEKLSHLKQQLQKVFKFQKAIREKPDSQGNELTINSCVETFFKTIGDIENKDDDDYDDDVQLEIRTDPEQRISNFIDVLDLALTQPNTSEDSKELLDIAQQYCTDSNDESSYINFYKTITGIFIEVNKSYAVSIKEILCDPKFSFNIETYKRNENFYSDLCILYDTFLQQLNNENVGTLNIKHAAHSTFFKMQELCINISSTVEVKDQPKYLQRLINYLKAFSKIYYIQRNYSELISNGKETSFFRILDMSRSNVLEKMLFKTDLDIYNFEQLFLKLKLDLVHHVATIFFPKVYLNTSSIDTTTQKREAVPCPFKNIISYIQKQNWLLAFILNAIYKIDEDKLDLNEIRIKTLINFIKLPRIQYLKALYNNNEVIAALHQHVDLSLIKSYFEEHNAKNEIEEIFQQNPSNIHMISENLETGEEMFEGEIKIINWKHLFNIIDSISSHQLFNSKELRYLKDKILCEIVGDCFEIDFFKYVRLITNNRMRVECILNNLTTWPGKFCIETIKSELSNFSELGEEYRTKLITWLDKIELYESMTNILQKNLWFDVLLYCQNKPQDVLQSLLNTVKIELLLKFIMIHEITEENLRIIDETYFIALLDSNVDLLEIRELFRKLSNDKVIDICRKLLKILKKLDHFNFIIDVISNMKLPYDPTYKNIQISLKILSCFSPVDLEQLWCLITEPLSIIEMLIMNTRLEKLGLVLEKIKPNIENCEYDENQLSVDKIDETLRNYAEKSLEFRVILQTETRYIRTPESTKLLQSLDSITFPSGKKNFVMPELVPLKEEWVQNDEVTECMCCLESTFSMFNRRHHCRRCGRVVCGACSLKRMQVATYEDIPVRVCLDCYEQSHQESVTTSSSKSELSMRSIGWDYWLLTDDPNHNHVVREEFSFEYAPSVSLCLAILKYHSKTEEYLKFLINQCKAMLQLLQPVNPESIEEIDYLLVIKMLKSLALAAKVVSSQCMLQWGTSLADKLLSQADLLGLLAERGCLHLINSSNQSRFIEASILRQLRDKLIEREQWNLALEVSTKAGLNNIAVFASWGKTYLKAGCLQLAREKFQRCFDKRSHGEVELSDRCISTQKAPLKSSDNRPLKNSPLLNEIIHILETTNCTIDPSIITADLKRPQPLSSSSWSLSTSTNISLQHDPALCIMNKLKNLKNIASGKYIIPENNNTKPHLDNIFYEECVYYLTTYGSHISLLEFYVKHGNFLKCLRHILENQLSNDIFIEIYMFCLRENLTNLLHEGMSKIDSTLEIWRDYLRSICRYLESQGKLNSLYQLQLFIGDFVRAAMTCIKFYRDDATSYLELTSRVDHLRKAQQHLQQELEQEQWVEVASVQKSSMDGQNSYETKAIVNSSLVMKMDAKNVDRHINTIWRQIEVTKFLAECETSGMSILEAVAEMLPFTQEGLPTVKIPTLFGSYYEKLQLAVLAIISGKNVDDGFGIAFRIIQDYKLNPVKVYCQGGKQFAKSEKYDNIAQLVNCIQSSGVNDDTVTNMCDEMLTLAVQTLNKANASPTQLDGLIKLITDRNAKISAYIESKQLKSAYILAVKCKRIGDIRRILREAEFLNQPHIKTLCQKILLTYSHSPSRSKD